MKYKIISFLRSGVLKLFRVLQRFPRLMVFNLYGRKDFKPQKARNDAEGR